MHKRSWLSKTVWNWYLVVKSIKNQWSCYCIIKIFFFGWLFQFYIRDILFLCLIWLYMVLQKPIGIIALLDEAWYSISSLLLLGACCSLNCLVVALPYPDFFILAACFPNQHIKHSQTSSSRIFGLTQDWKRQNFLKQILSCPTTLARHVISCRLIIKRMMFWLREHL